MQYDIIATKREGITMIPKICAIAALALAAGCAGTPENGAKKPCARIGFDLMPQLMRFGDTAQRDELGK